MFTAVQCTLAETQRCQGYVRGFFVNTNNSPHPEFETWQEQVLNSGGHNEQGPPRLHAHPCPRKHPLHNTQVRNSR